MSATRSLHGMKTQIVSLALAALIGVVALPAAADCYADYKASRDNPLRLHYGVIALPDRACGTPSAAQAEIAGRIAVDGWTLLTVVSVFDETGLANDERRSNAGAFYLRY